MLLRGRSPLCRAARSTRAGRGPTAPSTAGDPTRPTGRTDPPPRRAPPGGPPPDVPVTCWRARHDQAREAPPGTFTRVSIGEAQECGLRPGGSITCWGARPFESAVRTAPSSGEEEPAEDAGVHQPVIDALNRLVPGLFDGTGCEQGLCPHDPLRRWETAVWLVRVLDRAVTRGQMATFLVRAFGLEGAVPAGFADTAGNTHEAAIDALAAVGIAAACSTDPLRFCPSEPVTRGQMATALHGALLRETEPGPEPEPVQFSTEAPDADLVDMSTGESVNLRSFFTGKKPVLLWFWAGW